MSDPQFIDLCTHLDGVIGLRPATDAEIQAARMRLDRQAVHCHQQSPQRFIAEWGIDPADVPLFYPERTER
jgi:hypothetical protein